MRTLFKYFIVQKKNKILQEIKYGSKLKTIFVVFSFSLLFLFFTVLFYEGFSVILKLPVIGKILFERIVYIFFLVVSVFILISSFLLFYQQLFTREYNFLKESFISYNSIFWYLQFKTFSISVWGFIFLGMPFLISFDLQLSFKCIFLLPFQLGILLTLGVIYSLVGGMIGCGILGINEKVRRYIILVVFLIPFILFFSSVIKLQRESFFPFSKTLLKITLFSKNEYLPSTWCVDILLSLVRERYKEIPLQFIRIVGIFLLLIGIGNILSPLLGKEFLCVSKGKNWIKLLLKKDIIGPIIVKDVVVFLRSPSQWLQLIIFFGIIFLYTVYNLQRSADSPFWVQINNISALFACGFTLSSFTLRFFYPLISKEMKGDWFLFTSSFSFKKIVLQKFYFAFIISFIVIFPIFFCREIFFMKIYFQSFYKIVVLITLCSGLCALAVGMGGIFHEQNKDPELVLESYGGVITIILSIIYVVLQISIYSIYVVFFKSYIWLSLGNLILGALFTYIPLRILYSKTREII